MQIYWPNIIDRILSPLPEKLRVSLYWKLKTYFKYNPEPSIINPLSIIGKKYKCDKAGPATNYTEKFYYEILKPYRTEEIKILELGVGNTGSSVKMWREFLPNAQIYLFDPFFLTDSNVTVTKEKLEELNINVIIGNQLSRKDLQKLKKYGKFDFIIDDAAHVNDAHQISLATLFPYLKSKGLFIIEDLLCTKRRSSDIEDLNSFLDGEYVDQNIRKIYHKKELPIMYSLKRKFSKGTWESYCLSKDEKEYLRKNIQFYRIIRDYDFSNNVVIIKKD